MDTFCSFTVGKTCKGPFHERCTVLGTEAVAVSLVSSRSVHRHGKKARVSAVCRERKIVAAFIDVSGFETVASGKFSEQYIGIVLGNAHRDVFGESVRKILYCRSASVFRSKIVFLRIWV